MSEGCTCELKSILSQQNTLKICILDNGSIEFFTWVKDIIQQDKILGYYDIILIPGWVWAEVSDSGNRVQYINDLINKYSKKTLVINETEYSELIGYRDAELYSVFVYSCEWVARIVSFMKKNILKGRPLEDLEPYEEYLQILYEDGFDKKTLKNGRVQKKNAGEVSISVLAHILSYYYSEKLENITVFSSDRDAYDFINGAKKKFDNDVRFNKNHRVITFKSNDFLIYEWTSRSLIGKSSLNNFINEFRQERYLKYTRKINDISIEEQDRIISNKELYSLINDDSVHIIF